MAESALPNKAEGRVKVVGDSVVETPRDSTFSAKEIEEAKKTVKSKERSDGSSAGYYDFPEGASIVQDLISYRNMNAQIGEIFRLCYVYGNEEIDGMTPMTLPIPDDARMLQDLISFCNMNAQLGEVFRACFRMGHVEHSEEMRDARKIKFYLDAEATRLKKYESNDKAKHRHVVQMQERVEAEISRLEKYGNGKD